MPSLTSAPPHDVDLTISIATVEHPLATRIRCSTAGPYRASRIPVPATTSSASPTASPTSSPPMGSKPDLAGGRGGGGAESQCFSLVRGCCSPLRRLPHGETLSYPSAWSHSFGSVARFLDQICAAGSKHQCGVVVRLQCWCITLQVADQCFDGWSFCCLERAPVVTSGNNSPTNAACAGLLLPLEKRCASVDGTCEATEGGNGLLEAQICTGFSKSISLEVKKGLQKCATFPPSSGEAQQEDHSCCHADDGHMGAPTHERSLSLPLMARADKGKDHAA